MQINLEYAKARIKELVLCDGGNTAFQNNNNNNMFSTETSVIRKGQQSPWLDISEIDQKIQSNNNIVDPSPNIKLLNKVAPLSIDPNANQQMQFGQGALGKITSEQNMQMNMRPIGGSINNRSPRFSNTVKVDIDNMANFFSNTNEQKIGSNPNIEALYSPNKSMKNLKISQDN